MQNNYDNLKPCEQVIVRLNNGVLAPGEAGYAEGSGTDARVMPQR